MKAKPCSDRAMRQALRPIRRTGTISSTDRIVRRSISRSARARSMNGLDIRMSIFWSCAMTTAFATRALTASPTNELHSFQGRNRCGWHCSVDLGQSCQLGHLLPETLRLLRSLDHDTSGFRSKYVKRVRQTWCTALDLAFTVCDNAAGEVCPVTTNDGPLGVPDPEATGAAAEIALAFKDTYR